MGIPALPFCHLVLKTQKPKPAAYPKEIKTLGDHIRKKRLDLGLLQRQVAEQIGVDEATIWNWESNATTPAVRLMPRILRFLGYDPFKPSESLGEKLKSYRMRLGLSRKNLAKKLGIDPSTLARWETPKGGATRRIQEIIDRLLGGTMPPTQEE